MPPDTATPAAAPPVSDAAETQALIQQIVAEARAEGATLGQDASEEGEDAPPPAKAKPKANPPSKTEADQPEDSNNEEQENGEAEEQQAEDDAGEQEQPARQVSPEAVIENAAKIVAALQAEGAVDIVALADALGTTPEALGVSPATHAAMRAYKRKADGLVSRAQELGKRLHETYGDQSAARKAVEQGDLMPAVEFCEKTFGMSWNELNRVVGQLLQGKPVKDLEQKRELFNLKRKEAEREETAKKQAAEAERSKKVADAKAWIRSSIKGDKLASPELEKQLSEAGFPTIADLVFEEIQAGYSKGLTDPRKALERVKQKLTKQARALASTGLAAPTVAKATPKPKPLTNSSRPRADAQTGAAGNGRPMSDKELREAVLKEHGLWRA